MRYINLRFTYLLTYLHQSVQSNNQLISQSIKTLFPCVVSKSEACKAQYRRVSKW